MPFTFIYTTIALLLLIVVFFVAYRLRGLRLAIGLSIAIFIILGSCYLALVAIATSQM
jgi:hypothetical protein